MERHGIEREPETDFPENGYGMSLRDVFEKFGPVHGITELQRRSTYPPTVTAEAEIAVDIMRDLGQIVDIDDNA